jgi:hypothetical protein
MTTKKCTKWSVLLGEYALGTVAPRDRERLEAHLTECVGCRASLAETRRLYRLLEPYKLPEPSPYFAAKVTRALRGVEAEAAASYAAPAARRAPWWRVPAGVSAVAAVAVAVLVFVVYTRTGGPRPAGESTPAAAPGGPKVGEAGRAMAPDRERRGAPPAFRGEAEKSPMATPAVPPAARDGIATLTRAEAPEEETPDVEGRLGSAGVATEAAFGARGAGGGAGGYGLGAADATATAGVSAAEKEKKSDDELSEAWTRLDRERAAAITPFSAEAPAEGVASVSTAAWLDPRIEADVDKLTNKDALLEYVAPNGALMVYIYELPAEDQREVLSRLRTEMTAVPATEILYTH